MIFQKYICVLMLMTIYITQLTCIKNTSYYTYTLPLICVTLISVEIACVKENHTPQKLPKNTLVCVSCCMLKDL